ncbi:MAG: proton-conducting transporter membrane subunit, partial [Bdellovibrionia bacterium]
SAFLASAFGRLQTTIKGQIAYASSAQVGMMFLELALGFNRLVLLHFVGNALLRGYQLLTAPSIVSDQLRFHSAHGGIIYRSRWLPEIILPNRLVELSFLFCLNEGYIDAISERIVQAVLNFLGWVTSILFPLWRPNREYKSSRTLIIFSLISTLIMCATGLGLVLKITAIAYLLLIVSVLFAILAFQEISNPFATLFFVFISQICPVLAASLLDSHAARELAFYTISIATGLAFATFSLGRISRDRKWKDAFRINGLVKTYPNTASLFFFTSISMVGFPLTFTFIGEDLLFHHLVPHSMIGAASVCFNYVLNGFTIIRMFGNIFLGKSRKSVSIENFGLTPNHALWAFCTFLFLQVVPLIFWRYYGI